jgi:hypothetical protein
MLGNGANGNAGGFGNAGGLGSYQNSGFSPEKGSDGIQGSPGNGGGAGSPGETVGCSDCSFMNVIVNDAMPQIDAGTCSPATTYIEGGIGQPGCGGGGGHGGSGGTGGGGSIGLYLVGSGKVAVRFGSLIAATSGGIGGSGADGVNGGPGLQGPWGSQTIRMNMACNANNCTPTGSCVADGGAGGTAGGLGGMGGQGGGGAGGPSVAVVRQNSVQYQLLDGSVITFSNGGDGGAPNGKTPGDQGMERTFQ